MFFRKQKCCMYINVQLNNYILFFIINSGTCTSVDNSQNIVTGTLRACEITGCIVVPGT